MIATQLTTETKKQIWERQNGMCGLTGRKFELFSDSIEADYHHIKPNVSGDNSLDNFVMILRSADLNTLKNLKGEEIFKKYQFPYANITNYPLDEKLNDIRMEVEYLLEISNSSTEWKEMRNRHKEISSIMQNLSLPQENTQELSDKLNSALELVIARQKAEYEANQKEFNENYDRIKVIVNSAVDASKTEPEYKKSREALLAAQNEFKSAKLLREHKEEFIQLINNAFEDLNKRQMEERENYEMECIENYHSLKAKVDEAISFANSSPNFTNARKALIEAQGEIKGKRLKREQRDSLYQVIRDCFDALNVRQSEERISMDSESEANYAKIKKVVDEAISFAQNVNDNFKEARETLISAQGAIKNTRLRKEQRDELYAAIRSVFEEVNSKQSEDREKYEKECSENYSKLKTKVEEAFVDVENTGDFRLIREGLIAVQNEIRILKLTKDQRTELFTRLRGAFELFDKRRNEYFEKRKEDKANKLTSIKSNLEMKIDRLKESIEKDNESLEIQKNKLAEVGDNESFRGEIEQRINAINDRIKEKQEKIIETEQRIKEIENEATEEA